jgi:hypothetical protein
MKAFAIFCCLLLLASASARAQAPTASGQAPPPEASGAVAEKLKALEERIRALEAEVQLLRAAQAQNAPAPGVNASGPSAEAPMAPSEPAPAPAPAPAQAGAAQLPHYGGAAAMSKVLNPDVSVIGNFLGAVGRNRVRQLPVLNLSETEVGFQAIIDPYARGDIFISLTPEGVDVEEAYVTFTSLPGGLLAKVGKMRSAFGKVNAMHTHVLPWTDRPLVTENLVGGDEGIGDAGVSVSRIFAGPKELFLEATGEVYRGEAGDVFTPTRQRDVAVVGHLRGYKDLSESTNLDLGFSYARGYNDAAPDLVTNLYGVDATLRWKPLRRAIYNSFIARTELIWSNREEIPGTQHAFGFYTSGEYRMNRRWTVGGRYDRSERARDASLVDSGFSAILTYWPSEFSQIRGQYRFARYAEKQDANELRFQFLFVLGAHGAHPF